MKVSKKLQLGKLATPLPDRKRPVHRWFQLKESFSSGLVQLLAETWGLGEGDLVLDPFSGAGTTALACKELGVDCTGHEPHPVFLFASETKLKDYRAEELRQVVEKITKVRFENVEAEVPGYMRRVIPKHLLADVVFFKNEISGVDERLQGFLSLGLAGAVFGGGGVYKDGAAVKVGKKSHLPFREVFRRKLFEMCSDVEQFKGKSCDVRIKNRDARDLELSGGSVDAVITSPPYLQKPEYIRAYAVEQWLWGLDEPETQRFVGAQSGPNEGSFSEIEPVEDEPHEANVYFKEMLDVIRELHRVCKPRATVCMVVSDGCFQTGVVEVGVRLSRLAEKVGFKPKRVMVVNERWATTPSRKKIGVMNESLLFWEKPSAAQPHGY